MASMLAQGPEDSSTLTLFDQKSIETRLVLQRDASASLLEFLEFLAR